MKKKCLTNKWGNKKKYIYIFVGCKQIKEKQDFYRVQSYRNRKHVYGVTSMWRKSALHGAVSDWPLSCWWWISPWNRANSAFTRRPPKPCRYINILIFIQFHADLYFLFFFLNVRRNSSKSAWKTWAHWLLWEHPHFYFSERKNNEEMAEVVDGVSRCVACYKTILASQHLGHCPVKAIVGNTRSPLDWPRFTTTL